MGLPALGPPIGMGVPVLGLVVFPHFTLEFQRRPYALTPAFSPLIQGGWWCHGTEVELVLFASHELLAVPD